MRTVAYGQVIFRFGVIINLKYCSKKRALLPSIRVVLFPYKEPQICC